MDCDGKGLLGLRIDQSCFEIVEKCSVFIIFDCSNDAVLNSARWPFLFEREANP